VKRWPGSITIAPTTVREFESFKFPVKDGGGSKLVEGRYLFNQYQLPAGTGCTQVIRNFENAFKAQGLAIHTGVEAPTEDVGWGTGKWVSGEGKAKSGGQLYLVAGCPDDNPEGVVQYLWVVEKQQMEQKMEVDADAMAEEISKSGHIALYGINFAVGKAEVTADSGKTLEQIAALLKAKPEWKLRIEGHTDNAGQAKANLELSKKRAEAVKGWLTTKSGVAGGRLSTDGFGDKKPLGPNTTEEGRAKNRRVELFKL
jgi:OOP family OmpA-OmpF porin